MAMVGFKEIQKRLSSVGISKKTMSAQSAKAFTTLMQRVKPTVFWEVGDTIGAYAWLALEHSSMCKTFLFEANSDNYLAHLNTIASKQLHRAEANNIVISPVSVGRSDCAHAAAATVGAMSRFAPYEQETTVPLTKQRGGSATETGTVETLTLNELLTRGFASPDIIKLEAEDTERLLVDGARQVLETCSPLLIVKSASPTLIRYLERLSYRSFAFDQDNTIFISVYF